MTALAIVNPRSGGGRTRRAMGEIERALCGLYPSLEIANTRKRGDATSFAREALERGYSEIVAVGGDGTINEVVNGFFGPEGERAPEAVLAFVTSGTGGDFRKSFGIGQGHEAAIARLKQARVHALDVGRLSCLSQAGKPEIRHFINIGSFGLSGVIVDAVNRARIAKFFGGRFAFGFHSARVMLGYRERKVRLRIDGVLDEIAGIATVAVANGQYFGGGMRVAPEARPDDGLFDIVVMGGAGNAIGDLRLLYTGAHIGRPGVRVFRGAKLVAAPVAETGGHAVLIEVDGESAGRLPATFEILPRALKVRC